MNTETLTSETLETFKKGLNRYERRKSSRKPKHNNRKATRARGKQVVGNKTINHVAILPNFPNWLKYSNRQPYFY